MFTCPGTEQNFGRTQYVKTQSFYIINMQQELKQEKNINFIENDYDIRQKACRKQDVGILKARNNCWKMGVVPPNR